MQQFADSNDNYTARVQCSVCNTLYTSRGRSIQIINDGLKRATTPVKQLGEVWKKPNSAYNFYKYETSYLFIVEQKFYLFIITQNQLMTSALDSNPDQAVAMTLS